MTKHTVLCVPCISELPLAILCGPYIIRLSHMFHSAWVISSCAHCSHLIINSTFFYSPACLGLDENIVYILMEEGGELVYFTYRN